MKELFSYNLTIKSTQEVTEELEPGKKTITTKEIDKPVKIIIKEPSRKNLSDSKDIYNQEWSRCVSNGIVTRAILDKKYRSEKGIFTADEVKGLDEIQSRLLDIRAEYKELEKIENKSAEQNKKINDLLIEFSGIQNQLEELEQVNESLYRTTAESLAKEKEILYNILFLSYIEENGKVIPLVEGETLEERLEKYDEILDKNDEKAKLYSRIIDRNGYFINLLSRGKIEISQLKTLNEQFDEAEKPKVPAITENPADSVESSPPLSD